MHPQARATRYIVFVGVFSALAEILILFFEFPVIPGVPSLKLDFSDWAAAVAGLLLGPSAAVLTELIKCLLHVLLRGLGDTMGYGDLMNFIVGVALTAPFSAVLRALLRRADVKEPPKGGHAGRSNAMAVTAAGAVGLVCMAAAGVAGNLLLAPPYFSAVVHFKLTNAALWGFIGSATILNVIKPVCVALLTAPVVALGHKRLLHTMA